MSFHFRFLSFKIMSDVALEESRLSGKFYQDIRHLAKRSVLTPNMMMKNLKQLATHEVREAIPLGDAFPKEPPMESFGPSGRQRTQ